MSYYDHATPITLGLPPWGEAPDNQAWRRDPALHRRAGRLELKARALRLMRHLWPRRPAGLRKAAIR